MVKRHRTAAKAKDGRWVGKQSAGIIVYHLQNQQLEVLLVHPGGPFFAKKDQGAWSIPKGEFSEGEEPLAAARREFSEELGLPVPSGELLDLGTVDQNRSKRVQAWAVQGSVDTGAIKSNTFSLEWPPRSGKQQEFSEVDRAEWFNLTIALQKIIPGQAPLLERLAEQVGTPILKAPQQTSLDF